MSTSNDPRARLQRCFVAPQSALGVVADAGDFVRRAFYDYTPQVQSAPQDDEIIGADYQNGIDDTPGAPDTERGSVAIAWPLDLIQIGYALTEALGAPTTSGSTTKTHTFSSGASAVLPSRTIERMLASGQYDGVIGAVLRTLRFPIGSDRGYTQVQANYFTRQHVKQYASPIAVSPTVPSLANRVPRAVGTIKKNGVALGSILSGDFTLTNMLGEDAYHGSALVEDVQVEGRKAAINLTARFKGAAMRDLGELPNGALVQDANEIELAWELSATMKLVITIAGVRFAKTGVAARGVGRLDVCVPFLPTKHGTNTYTDELF